MCDIAPFTRQIDLRSGGLNPTHRKKGTKAQDKSGFVLAHKIGMLSPAQISGEISRRPKVFAVEQSQRICDAGVASSTRIAGRSAGDKSSGENRGLKAKSKHSQLEPNERSAYAWSIAVRLRCRHWTPSPIGDRTKSESRSCRAQSCGA